MNETANIKNTGQAPPGPENDATEATTPWRSLRLFNIYRLIVYALFFILALEVRLGTPWLLLPARNLPLLLGVSGVMLLLAIAAAATIYYRRPGLAVQAPAFVFSDIVAFTLILHALGGTGSGAGVLLVASLGAGALLLPPRVALAFAAIASLAVLGERVHSGLTGFVSPGSYTQAGMLGVAYFAITMLAVVFARRARESAELAEQRGEDLADMAQLNELIIQRMRAGVVVVGTDGEIVTLNESAWYLMGMPSPRDRVLGQASAVLAEALDVWQATRRHSSRFIRLGDETPAVVPHFAPLGRDRDAGTLITLEDSSLVERRAQEINLASLGRLTVSIAHQIRNPLGTISHAVQLLAESSGLKKPDKRLAEIIRSHSSRVNEVVENVLQLSRIGETEPEELVLENWLRQFMDEFCRENPLDPELLKTEFRSASVRVRADRYQLHQLVWNLCSNAARYGLENEKNPEITLRVGISAETENPYLEVMDRGPGIDSDQVDKIFEPFYTSEAEGAGLGLYIARQLAEANQARLLYKAEPGGGSCFRISFFAPTDTKATPEVTEANVPDEGVQP